MAATLHKLTAGDGYLYLIASAHRRPVDLDCSMSRRPRWLRLRILWVALRQRRSYRPRRAHKTTASPSGGSARARSHASARWGWLIAHSVARSTSTP